MDAPDSGNSSDGSSATAGSDIVCFVGDGWGSSSSSSDDELPPPPPLTPAPAAAVSPAVAVPAAANEQAEAAQQPAQMSTGETGAEAGVWAELQAAFRRSDPPRAIATAFSRVAGWSSVAVQGTDIPDLLCGALHGQCCLDQYVSTGLGCSVTQTVLACAVLCALCCATCAVVCCLCWCRGSVGIRAG
jgi:hypothetical protein